MAPCIFKLGLESIMLQIWLQVFMHFFVAGKCWCTGDSSLDEDSFKVGQLFTCA